LTRRHPAGVCGVADLKWGVCAYVGDVRVRYKPRIPSKKGTKPRTAHGISARELASCH
jgi:hypothetical protein